MDDCTKQILQLRNEVIPGILKYLQDEKIPASMAEMIPEMLSSEINLCNRKLLEDSEFKAYTIQV